MKKIDMLGRKIGHWEVVSNAPSRNGEAFWTCRCSCGVSKEVNGQSLRQQKSLSCGNVSSHLDMLRLRLKGRKNLGEGAKRDLFYQYQLRAKQRDLDWQLTEDEFFGLTQQNCHYCGEIPRMQTRMGKTSFASVYIYNGVDRVDNALGYFPSNVVACCKICNSAKNILSVEEFLAWVTRVYHRNVAKAVCA